MNEQLTLLEVPKDHPSTRELRAAEVKRLKEKHDIWTHGVMDGGKMNWMAFPILICHDFLKGYLTDEDRKDPFVMFAGYCRLIDEAGLCTDGHRTELEAVKAAVKIAEQHA